ncbi:hypothetical protein MAHJHV57_52110 [Mycobacterium avium subsp. hominissuis]
MAAGPNVASRARRWPIRSVSAATLARGYAVVQTVGAGGPHVLRSVGDAPAPTVCTTA